MRPLPGNKSPGMATSASSGLGMVILPLSMQDLEVRTKLPDLDDTRTEVVIYLGRRPRFSTRSIRRPGVTTLSIRWPNMVVSIKMVVRGMTAMMMEIQCSEGPDT